MERKWVEMEALDYWMLNEEFSIQETIMLSLGFLPGDRSYEMERVVASKRPKGYDALKKLLLNKIKGNQIDAKIEYVSHNDFEGTVSIDLDSTSMLRDDIIQMFREIGFKPNFFFPIGSEDQNYVDRGHPFYAPKLAAAIAAWEAVTKDETLLNGKTPKQALQKWLREHATQFNLTKDDGNPNETGIDDICKIANWKPEGGAARTPTQVTKNPTTPKKAAKNADFLA